MDNPLYQYVFQSDAAGNGFPLSDPVYLRRPIDISPLTDVGDLDG
jgi:hypothetical protein